MPAQAFFPSLADAELGGTTGDFVVVEWSDSSDSGHEHEPGASDFAAIFREHDSELLS